MNKFEALGISEDILDVIEEEGFTEPTEIQRQSIPILMEGQDVIAGSATGSGKTLAFSCPIIEVSQKGEGVQAIVLTPTRELAEHRKAFQRRFAVLVSEPELADAQFFETASRNLGFIVHATTDFEDAIKWLAKIDDLDC